MTLNIENIVKRIKERDSEITEKKIVDSNKKLFEDHFNDTGDDIFIHPSECVKSADDEKKSGYVYRGIYERANGYVELSGVEVYESDNVAYENGHNVYKNLKKLKNKSGKDLFSIDELASFDYKLTQKARLPMTSSKNNKIQATKEVMKEITRKLLNTNKQNS